MSTTPPLITLTFCTDGTPFGVFLVVTGIFAPRFVSISTSAISFASQRDITFLLLQMSLFFSSGANAILRQLIADPIPNVACGGPAFGMPAARLQSFWAFITYTIAFSLIWNRPISISSGVIMAGFTFTTTFAYWFLQYNTAAQVVVGALLGSGIGLLATVLVWYASPYFDTVCAVWNSRVAFIWPLSLLRVRNVLCRTANCESDDVIALLDAESPLVVVEGNIDALEHHRTLLLSRTGHAAYILPYVLHSTEQPPPPYRAHWGRPPEYSDAATTARVNTKGDEATLQLRRRVIRPDGTIPNTAPFAGPRAGLDLTKRELIRLNWQRTFTPAEHTSLWIAIVFSLTDLYLFPI